jgi:hypothetical protein
MSCITIVFLLRRERESEFFHQITIIRRRRVAAKVLLTDFVAVLENHEDNFKWGIGQLKSDVERFAGNNYLPLDNIMVQCKCNMYQILYVVFVTIVFLRQRERGLSPFDI